MAVPVSLRLKEKFGEDVFEDLELWVKQILKAEGVTKDEYRQILSRLDLLDKGYGELKEEVYRLRGELSTFRSEVDGRIDSFREDMDARIDKIHELLDGVNVRIISSIKWTVGTIALFGTIIAVLLAIFNLLGR